MIDSPMKKFVLMGYRSNEQGFTYVSMFIALTIISITLPFFSYLFQISNHLSTNYSELSTQQFFQFLRDELIRSEDMNIRGNSVILTRGESEVSISLYGNSIRRQVDGKGHEILLQDVSELTIEPRPYGIHVHITNLEGNSYEKTIVFYQ